jgi:hypothetical protein
MPEKKRLLRPAIGDIIHKQWNIINKRHHHCQERYPTRPAETDLRHKAIGEQGEHPTRPAERHPSREAANEVVQRGEVTFSLNVHLEKCHLIDSV